METRELLAQLGVRSVAGLVGRTELIEVMEGFTEKQKALDLSAILTNDQIPADKPQVCGVSKNEPFDKGELAERLVAETAESVAGASGGEFRFAVTNCDRSIGARVSGEIAQRHGNQGMAANPIKLRLTGTAGQSFGVFNAGGLEMYLEGDANDYVGKGMTGGKLVLFPPKGSPFKSQETSIVGNTCLYGATGGKLFASGRAGERFGVRNSGAHAVVEGTGDHCCEYMTGGLITVLVNTGYNFGAGMTGGFAYVLDVDKTFVDKYNHELVEIHRINNESMEAYRNHLVGVIKEFVAETQSLWGQHILEEFDDFVGRFWLVKPKAASLEGLLANIRTRNE